MISVEEASRLVLEQRISLAIEEVKLADAVGRYLAEDLTADRDFPPFDRVTMDGIAIRFPDFENGQRSFPVSGIAPAGTAQRKLEQPATCLEVMTGAVMPAGVDTVIRYEDLELKNGMATISESAKVNAGQNVHHQGRDRKQGDLLIPSGRKIQAPEIGIAATIGKEILKVYQWPRVAIISTGDELVAVGDTPKPHQIRQSNVHQIRALLRQWGLPTDHLHLRDDLAESATRLREAAAEYDVLLISGGVSKGKFDFIPQALDDIGVERLFHRVAQRPGKPFWFGRNAETIVFALPGNPVSSFMCTLRYFKPWLLQCLGERPAPVVARLTAPITFKPDLVYLIQVATSVNADGVLEARPVAGNGSGDLASLSSADGFLELPRGREVFEIGEYFKVYSFR